MQGACRETSQARIMYLEDGVSIVVPVHGILALAVLLPIRLCGLLGGRLVAVADHHAVEGLPSRAAEA